MSPDYLSIKDASKFAGKSVTTIRKWVKLGLITIKPRKSDKSKVFVHRQSLMAFLQVSGQPTIEGTGQTPEHKRNESETLKNRISELKETIAMLQSQIENHREIDNQRQRLITDLTDNLQRRISENDKILVMFSQLKSDNQKLSDDNLALTTQNNALQTYFSLKWWQRIGATQLLTTKDPS